MSEIKFNVTGEDYVKINVTSTSNPILFNYHTLNGNNPNANNNYIGVWPSDNGNVPLNTPADSSMLIASAKTSDNSQDFDYSLGTGEYILGYCLTGDPTDGSKNAYKSVCATVLIPAKESRMLENIVYNTFKLNVRANDDTYFLDYRSVNNMDLKDKSWVGIWFESENIGNDVPQWSTSVTKSGTENYIKLSGISRDKKYKLGFFYGVYDSKKLTGDACKNLVALLSFSTY